MLKFADQENGEAMLNNIPRSSEIFSRRRLLAAAAAFVGGLGLSGCSIAPWESASHPNEISACPSRWPLGESLQVKNTEKAFGSLQNGIAKLKSAVVAEDADAINITDKSLKGPAYSLNGISAKLLPAAESVFPEEQSNSVLSHGPVIMLGEQTKLFDLRQVFCTYKDNIYFTPAAQTASADLAVAGVRTNITGKN